MTRTVFDRKKPSPAKKNAEVEWISVLGVRGRMGPLGLWLYAKAFADSAQSLPIPTSRINFVRHYLACHSIELSLKAYLCAQGQTMLDMSGPQFGHDLATTLKVSEAHGLLSVVSLSSEQLQEVRKAAEYYKGKVFEYPALGEAGTGYRNLPNVEILIQVATILVRELKSVCLNAVNDFDNASPKSIK